MSDVPSISELVDGIVAFYREACEATLESASFELSTDDITAWEGALGRSLPSDYRVFLSLNRHAFYLNGNYEILTARQAHDYWHMATSHLRQGIYQGRVDTVESGGGDNWEDDTIQHVWWSPDWIPFAQDSAGNALCIDLAPGEEGDPGQIVGYELEQGPELHDEYADFRGCLSANLGYLRDGLFTQEDDDDWPEIEA